MFQYKIQPLCPDLFNFSVFISFMYYLTVLTMIPHLVSQSKAQQCPSMKYSEAESKGRKAFGGSKSFLHLLSFLRIFCPVEKSQAQSPKS